MLRLNPLPTFSAKVSIPDPSGPAQTLVVEFKHKTLAELDEYGKRTAGQPVAQTIPELVSGWSECDTPYSPDALQSLLNNYAGAGEAIARAYSSAIWQGRQGN